MGGGFINIWGLSLACGVWRRARELLQRSIPVVLGSARNLLPPVGLHANAFVYRIPSILM